MAENIYDLAVIGAGSAGFSAAITAAALGKKVALIGYGILGGTCVNVGCVPSKTLMRAAEAMHAPALAARFNGIEISSKLTSWQKVMNQKQDLVAALRTAKYSDILAAYDGVAYIEAKASFSPLGQLMADGRHILADKVIIASGSKPTMPDIDGIDNIDCLTSETALELAELPPSMLIVGGGYIGVELAQIFNRFGVQVTLVSRHGLLPQAEPEISQALAEYFAQEGIRLIQADDYLQLSQHGNAVHLTLKITGEKQVVSAEKLLIATGRHANISGLALHNAGINVSAAGGIEVDQYMQTSNADVYAVGDVTDGDQFVYMAAYGGKIAAKNALADAAIEYDNRIVPAVVFTDPQIAMVGLTEKQAVKAGFKVETSILSLDNLPRALAAHDVRGLIKLVADEDTKQLLGGHIIAPEGSDSIQTVAMAIKMGMTYRDLANMIFPYLTTVEGVKLAAQLFDINVKQLSCCAG